VALELFHAKGFEETTMDDIADAVGVSRRTVFRYYPSKNDIVWGDFSAVRKRLRDEFDASPSEEVLGESLRRAVVASNRYGAEDLPELRMRMALITSVPALQGHSMVRYEEWRHDVAEFVAGRLGGRAEDLAPRVIAQATMATAMAAFVHWVNDESADLEESLDRALRVLLSGFRETA
jgi:mycofactocin system transcriptional regulator